MYESTHDNDNCEILPIIVVVVVNVVVMKKNWLLQSLL